MWGVGTEGRVAATRREGPAAPTQAHIVLVEEGQVADDTDPDEQR